MSRGVGLRSGYKDIYAPCRGAKALLPRHMRLDVLAKEIRSAQAGNKPDMMRRRLPANPVSILMSAVILVAG